VSCMRCLKFDKNKTNDDDDFRTIIYILLFWVCLFVCFYLFIYLFFSFDGINDNNNNNCKMIIFYINRRSIQASIFGWVYGLERLVAFHRTVLAIRSLPSVDLKWCLGVSLLLLPKQEEMW
jgi:hypothetical protein